MANGGQSTGNGKITGVSRINLPQSGGSTKAPTASQLKNMTAQEIVAGIGKLTTGSMKKIVTGLRKDWMKAGEVLNSMAKVGTKLVRDDSPHSIEEWTKVGDNQWHGTRTTWSGTLYYPPQPTDSMLEGSFDDPPQPLSKELRKWEIQ